MDCVESARTLAQSEINLTTGKMFFPTTGSETEWNIAFYRLEDYFRALRLVNRLHQSQLILRLLQSAAARHALDPTQNPTALAMEEARGMMDRWFEGIFGQRERISVVGLISLLAVNAPEKWPFAFPSGEVPDQLRLELEESDLRAGPDLLISSMTPRPIDVGPLLEPISLPDALGRLGRGLAIFAVVLLASFSLYFFLMR
jgi:hypothetical protein